MTDIDFSSYNDIINGINKLLELPTGPAVPIPPALILRSSSRSGLSPKKIAGRIIQRQAQAGVPVGPLSDGSPNPAELMEQIRVEEILKALLDEGVIQVVIPPGVPITCIVASPVGPLPGQGSTIANAVGYALIR